MLSSLERRALASLPPSILRWEVGLLQAPLRVKDAPLEGVLLVLEEGTGLVRAVAPLGDGDPLWPVLARALHDPAPPTIPYRPRSIRCDDPSLCERLRDEIDGAHIVVEQVADLPGVRGALGSLAEHLTPGRVHGIDAEIPRWAATLSALCEVAPWHRLPDNHVFHFDCDIPELSTAVAAVIGLAGEQEGVILYRSRAMFDRFSALAEEGAEGDALAEVEASCLYLNDATEFDPAEQAGARADGLVLAGGRIPYVIGVDGALLRPLAPREQQVLLAAVEAIAALCARHPGYDERPCTAHVDTGLGMLVVYSEPPAYVDEPIAHAFPHSIFLTDVLQSHEERPEERVPAVVVKLGKRDAEALADQIASADSLNVEPLGLGGFGTGGVRIRLWAGDQHLGALCDIPDDGPHARELLAAPSIMVVVSAGGAKRTRLRQADVLATLRLANRPPEDPRSRHDPLFDRAPTDWPKVSDTLMRYAEGVFGSLAGAHADHVLKVLQVASTVWNAVVLADFVGNVGYLDDLRASGTPEALLDNLVRYKRQHYPGDPRVFGEVRVEWRGPEPRFLASSTLPVGYTIDGRAN